VIENMLSVGGPGTPYSTVGNTISTVLSTVTLYIVGLFSKSLSWVSLGLFSRSL